VNLGGSIRNICFLLSLTWFTGSPPSSIAYEYNDYLNPQEYLTRCFQSIGNIRLSFLDQRRSGVTTLDQAVNVCERLIDAPKINTTTGTIYSSDTLIPLKEAQAVVRRFHQYHEYFFENDTYEKIMEDQGKTRMLYDTALPAAYFTYAMFLPNPDYKLAVTENSALKIIRSGSNQNRYGSIVNTSNNHAFLEAYDSSNENGNPKFIESVDRGIFNGIKKITSGPASQLTAAPTDTHQPINNHETLGAGFIGTPSFMLLNNGMGDNSNPSGSMVLPRRISKNIMDVAFCREGPYLKAAHVPAGDVQTANSPPPFRSNVECNRCHSTMDPVSYAFRNTQYRFNRRENTLETPAGYDRCRSHYSNGNCSSVTSEQAILSVMYRTKDSQMVSGPSTNSFNWIVNSSGNAEFFKSKNYKGRLRFTSAFGTDPFNSEFNVLADSNTSGNQQLSELGNLVANSNDYFLCGAMKYSRMLFGTQIKINVDTLPELQSNANSQQVNLWNHLKSMVTSTTATTAFNAQFSNPKTLIKNLIRSPEFKSRAFGKRPPIQSITVNSVQPIQGPSGISTPVTISGTNFGPGTTVVFGGQPCTNVTIVSTSQLTCNAPALNLVGTVSVMVTRNNFSDVLPDGFKIFSQLTWNGGIKNIFQQSCIGCHGGTYPTLGLNFGSYNGFITTTNPLTSSQCDDTTPHTLLSISNGVIDPQNSLLIQKISVGGSMRGKLGNDPDAKVNQIIQWLQLGAPEN